MFFRKKSYKVICVGSVSKDVFFPTDEGTIIETPKDITSKRKIAFELGGKYAVADRYETVGGVAANVAHGLSRLGHQAGCYSKIGNDSMGKWVIGKFKNERVPTDLLFIDKKVETDLSAIIVLTQNGERTIFHNRDANEKLEIEDEKFVDASWVFISALNGNWKKNLEKLLVLKKKYAFSLALNPGQHNIKGDPKLMFQAMTQSDVLVLNKDEAIELILAMQKEISREQLNNEVFLLNSLKSSGVGIIGMTDGKRGAWGFDGRECWHCSIHTLNGLVDSTGAGDAFGSGFFSAILEGKPIQDGLRYGIANSGSVIGSYGTIDGLLPKDEMKNIIEKISPQRLN